MAIQTFTAAQVLTAAQMNALQANDYNQTVSAKVASYTLVAADKGTRITMSNASATTITVNTSLFAAGDSLRIQNIGAGTCTVTAGTATVTSAGSLAITQWGGGQLFFTSASAAIWFPDAGASSAKFGQIVQATYSTELAVTSSSYVTSNLSAIITPTLNTSKVYIICTSTGSIATTNYMSNTIFRGTVAGTNLSPGDAFARLYNSSASMAINYLDSPATTSATTYTLGVKMGGGTGYQHLLGATSVLTLIEVLA